MQFFRIRVISENAYTIQLEFFHMKLGVKIVIVIIIAILAQVFGNILF